MWHTHMILPPCGTHMCYSLTSQCYCHIHDMLPLPLRDIHVTCATASPASATATMWYTYTCYSLTSLWPPLPPRGTRSPARAAGCSAAGWRTCGRWHSRGCPWTCGCRVQGVGCRVQGVGCGGGAGSAVCGSGFRSQRVAHGPGVGCRVQSAGCIQGLGCGPMDLVQGAGCRVHTGLRVCACCSPLSAAAARCRGQGAGFTYGFKGQGAGFTWV